MVLDLCDETRDVMMIVDGGGSGGVFYKFLFSIPLPWHDPRLCTRSTRVRTLSTWQPQKSVAVSRVLP